MVRLAQQQQQQQLSSAAGANHWKPLTHLLSSVQKLLGCWHTMLARGPGLMQVVVRTLLPLVQQLQGCNTLIVRPAAAARSAPAASVQAGSSSSSSRSSSSSSSEHQLQRVLFGMQLAASTLLTAIDKQQQVDAGVAAEVLRLQNDPAVVEMQLQLLTAFAAQLHKHHTAQQQQQLPRGTARASSSNSSSSTQQQQQQPAKQQHRADLLPIPAFHQDMLQLLPGGQAYLDAAAEDAAGWGLDDEIHAVQLRTYAGSCCHFINLYLHRHLESIAGQQQLSTNAVVVSGAAVRLVLELTLLASSAVQRQREQQRQQQQQQQVLTSEDQAITDTFALQTWNLLGMQIKALVAASRSCLPPEVLQQAGLQLLQTLAAPLQQWQLSRCGDSFLHVAAAIPLFLGDTLHMLVTAACGAQPTQNYAPRGELLIRFGGDIPPQPRLKASGAVHT
jgi:hypothetical protein